MAHSVHDAPQDERDERAPVLILPLNLEGFVLMAEQASSDRPSAARQLIVFAVSWVMITTFILSTVRFVFTSFTPELLPSYAALLGLASVGNVSWLGRRLRQAPSAPISRVSYRARRWVRRRVPTWTLWSLLLLIEVVFFAVMAYVLVPVVVGLLYNEPNSQMIAFYSLLLIPPLSVLFGALLLAEDGLRWHRHS